MITGPCIDKNLSVGHVMVPFGIWKVVAFRSKGSNSATGLAAASVAAFLLLGEDQEFRRVGGVVGIGFGAKQSSKYRVVQVGFNDLRAWLKWLVFGPEWDTVCEPKPMEPKFIKTADEVFFP
jgi:DNA/RNA endonuclease G (NUC1)